MGREQSEPWKPTDGGSNEILTKEQPNILLYVSCYVRCKMNWLEFNLEEIPFIVIFEDTEEDFNGGFKFDS